MLFVGNTPWSTTEDDLREIFSVYGPIHKVVIGASTHLHLHQSPCTNSFPKAKTLKANLRGTPT